ncbi:MAG: cyanophycinase [candidate division WOR-3 bacterium]
MFIIPGGGNLSILTLNKLRDFLREAINREPSVVLIPTATASPENFDKILEHWKSVFHMVKLIKIHRKIKDLPSLSEFRESVYGADLVFFTGGDQARIIRMFLNSDWLKVLQEGLRESRFSIGGTSAGAAVLGDKCILKGNPAKLETVKISDGLNFLSGFVVDQHFKERKRFGRLIHACLAEGLHGVGVDEDTLGIFDFRGSLVKVLGSGFCWLFENAGNGKILLSRRLEI